MRGYPQQPVPGALASWLELAALPSAARPAHNLYAPVDTSGGTFGAVSIVPGLGMFANSQPFSNAQTFTSLAGISYPRNS